MTCCAYSCTKYSLHTQYMLLTHTDDMLCLQLHTIRSVYTVHASHSCSTLQYNCSTLRFHSTLQYNCSTLRAHSTLQYNCSTLRAHSKLQYNCSTLRAHSALQYTFPATWTCTRIVLNLEVASLYDHDWCFLENIRSVINHIRWPRIWDVLRFESEANVLAYPPQLIWSTLKQVCGCQPAVP